MKKYNRHKIKETLVSCLRSQPDIVFAIIYGSFLREKTWRDVDVAVFMRPEPELLRLGGLQSELEHRAGFKVDVTLLNRLYDKNPAFAQEVATTGEVVLNHVAFDEKEAKNEYVDFKVMCLKYFEDTRWLRHMMNEAFERRLKEKKFGKRNYVSGSS